MMAKLTFDNGMVIEVTVEELVELAENTGVKFPVEEGSEEYRKVVGRKPKDGDFVNDTEPLKVGDYVVPLESADDKYNITNTAMKLGKVVEELSEEYRDIRIEVVAHEIDIEVGKSYPVESKYFRKATDEEVAQAKQAKEEQKWAKIGRKPGEFKKGDIVRVVECTGAHEAGEIVELVEDGARLYRDKDGKRFVGRPVWFELIAPVESRVDIND